MSHKVTSIVPEHIQLERPELMKFMEAYYDFLQEPDQPGTFLKNLPVHRNIDDTATIFLELLQRLEELGYGRFRSRNQTIFD